MTLVTRDAAASQAFGLIGPALAKTGIETATFTGNGQPFGLDEETVKSSDFLLLGLSAPEPNAEEELRALEIARAGGVPYGFYADTFGAWSRECFAPYRDGVKLLTVVNLDEADKAKQLFSPAIIKATGNPVWEEFFYPRISREEARAKMGAGDDETVVLIPGGKETALNCLLWMASIAAIRGAKVRLWRIFISLHPGDRTDRSIYKRIGQLSPEGLAPSILEKEVLITAEAVVGADLVVDNRSTTGIQAACLRLPVVDVDNSFAARRAMTVFGTAYWEPCEMKAMATACAFDVDEFTGTIVDLFDPMSQRRRDQIKAQKQTFSRPVERGQALRQIVKAIQHVLAD